MRKRSLIISVIVITFLLIAGCGNKTTGSVVVSTSDFVKISLSDLSKNAKFYTFEDNGVKIKYFAVLGSDGKPRTAFDACDVCGGYKGYQQKGNDIVCRNCGRVFRIDSLGTKNKGYGCWPSYLPHEIKGNEMFIKKTDLKNGRHRFV